MSTGLAEREKAEEDLNPGQQHQDNLTDFSGAANPNSSPDMSAFENSFKNDTADPSQEDKNIANARNREEQEGRSSRKDTSQKNKDDKKSTISSSTPSSGGKFGKALNFAKKAGPLGPIILIFVISATFLGVISAPGLAIVQLSEALKTSLDDTLSNIELRTEHIFRAKMKGKAVSNGCKSGMGVRCKYKSMSEKQMTKMRKAGFSFEPDPPRRGLDGRFKPDKLKFTNAQGRTITVSAREFSRMYRTDAAFRSMANTAYNPKWKGLRDSFARKAFAKFKVDFADKLRNKTKSAMQRTLREFTRTGGAGDNIDINRNRIPDADDENSNNERRTNEDEAKSRIAQQRSGASGSARLGRVGLVGANMLFGAQMGICQVLKASELASLASRLLQYGQVMRYASMFFTASDKLKLGEQSHEEMELLGEILMHSDQRKEIYTEKAAGEIGFKDLFDMGDAQVDLTTAPQKNPDYQKNALESAGARTAMYGKPRLEGTTDEQYELSARDGQYIVGSGMGNYIDGLVRVMRTSTPFFRAEDCDFYENPLVQAGGLLLSIAAIALSGGGAAVIGGARAAAMSVVFALVMGYIEAKLSDMLSGANLDDNTKGVDAGNAWFSGAGALFGTAASARGITPASTEGEIDSMQNLRITSLETEARLARYEARSTPFDVMNQHSFLGSIVWNVSPGDVSAQSGFKKAAMAPLQILKGVSSALSPSSASAATVLETPRERFEQCNDPLFRDSSGEGSDDVDKFDPQATGINLKYADIMCNPRYSEPLMNLNADPERVADWVVDAAQADGQSGAPIKDRQTMENLHNNRVSAEEIGAANYGEQPNLNEITPTPDVYPRSTEHTTLNEQVAEVLRPDDDTLAYLGVPLNTPSEKLASYNPGSSSIDLAQASLTADDTTEFLPPPLRDAGLLQEEEYNPERDVRTYAHWYRYCRYGPEDGRTVPFGVADTDSTGDEPIFDRIGIGIVDSEYVSDGRECLRSNACKPGDNPNGGTFREEDGWTGDGIMKKRCRPPQYDIYTLFHMDMQVEEGMEEDDATAGSDDSTGITGEWVYPTDESATTYSSPFGPRWGTEHRGADLAGPEGTPIYAARDGEVIEAGPADGFGNWIIIRHEVDGKQVDTVYGHMWNHGVLVSKGDKVGGGEEIGLIGNNGQSTGAHLHFEIWEGGRLNGGTAVDPAPIIPIN